MSTPKAPILASIAAQIFASFSGLAGQLGHSVALMAVPAAGVAAFAAPHAAPAPAPAPTPEEAQVGGEGLSRSIIETTRPLGAAQQTELNAYVDKWVGLLAKAESDRDFEESRRMLIEPLRHVLATPAFASAYSSATLKQLIPIIDNRTDLRRAIHALQVVRYLRTAESITVLVDRLSSARVSDPVKRLVVAGLLEQALSDAGLNQAQFDANIRHIEAAARDEQDDLVVLREITALAAIVTRKPAGNVQAAPDSSKALATAAQIAILREYASRLPRATSPATLASKLETAQEIVIKLRDEWLTTAGASKEFNVTLVPALVGLLETLRQSSATAKSVELAAASSQLVASTETLLRLVANRVESGAAPGTGSPLVKAWEEATPEPFAQELDKWKALVSKAPYK